MNDLGTFAARGDSSPEDRGPLRPWDEHNRRLRDAVRPSDWRNPQPADRYNLVVIGGGPAGLVAAAGAAGLGARVALIERHLLGGDCLNTGCVPSKALLRAARAAAAVRDAAQFGVRFEGPVTVDFPAVMERLRRLRADLSRHDSADRFRSLGVDVFLGQARFAGPDSVEVEGSVLRFARAVVATGARPVVPPVPGLAEVPYLTHESIFSLTSLPRRLAILGAGPIGCEMAQAFARFGSEVRLLETASGVLSREDRDAAAILETALRRDGVRLTCGARSLAVARNPGAVSLRFESPDGSEEAVVDQILVAAGRLPNVEGLDLDRAGVVLGPRGIQVNDALQTSNPRIFACGDVCSAYPFTHAADFQARTVLRNALFPGRVKASALVIPRCTYTSPEIAAVGVAGNTPPASSVDTFTQPLESIDRAVLDGVSNGFVRVHVRRGTDQIVGATIVAEHAGDLLGELTLGLRSGLGLRAIGATIHPYPTLGDAVRKTGDLFQQARLKPWVRKLLQRWMAWQRRA